MFRSTKVQMSQKYENGQKRCTLCGVFIETANFRCPCCNAKLRTRSRNQRSRKKNFSQN